MHQLHLWQDVSSEGIWKYFLKIACQHLKDERKGRAKKAMGGKKEMLKNQSFANKIKLSPEIFGK